MLPLVYYLILFVCLIVIYLMKRSPTGPQPPWYPGALPLIGHAHRLLGNSEYLWNVMVNMQDDILRQGGLTAVNFILYTYYFITDPDDIQTIANTCLDKHYIYKFSKPLVGNGLVTADGLEWKPHRTLLNPAFKQQILNGFIGVFNDQGRRLVDQLSFEVGNGPFVPQKYIVSSIFESIAKTVLNLTSSQKKASEEYAESIDKIFKIYNKRIQKIWLHIPFIYRWSTLMKKEDELTRTLINISSSMIKNRKLEVQQRSNNRTNVDGSSDKFKPFLDMLLEHVDNKRLTDQEMREELDTIITAGYDTTATTLIYVLLVLGSHVDVQQRVWNEIQEVMGDSDRDVEKYDLPKLLYLEAVIKETLRLYTTVPLIARKTTKPVQLKNYLLPEGSNFILLLYGLHRHPIWGPDREQFRPERWLDPTTLPDHPNAFAGFSIGKRNCIGRVFAMMWMKTTLVHVFRRYRVTSDVSKLVCKMEILLKPSKGDEIQLELRD